MDTIDRKSEASEDAVRTDAKRERRFVRKLDAILVTWAFFAYLLKVRRDGPLRCCYS
jgi:hypothetical protein